MAMLFKVEVLATVGLGSGTPSFIKTGSNFSQGREEKMTNRIKSGEMSLAFT